MIFFALCFLRPVRSKVVRRKKSSYLIVGWNICRIELIPVNCGNYAKNLLNLTRENYR